MASSLNRRLLWAAAAVGVLLFALVVLAPARGNAAGVFRVPAPAGTSWSVVAGYNTATHTGSDPHAIDIVRTDADTANTPVLAPTGGTITFVDSDCLGIKDAGGMRILLCHFFPDSGISSGDSVAQGEYLGIVAPPGFAGNNGLSHIHLAVHQPSGGWGLGATVPLVGDYALEGQPLPDTSTSNAYTGTGFTSSNVLGAGDDASDGTGDDGTTPAPDAATTDDFVVDAGADATVEASAELTLEASAVHPAGEPLLYSWSQIDGPAVDFSFDGAALTFFAPPEPGSVLAFQVVAFTEDLKSLAVDMVVLTVVEATVVDEGPANTEGDGATQAAGARTIVAGSVPQVGFGLLVFGGGTNEQLIEASGCPPATARFWASSGGTFIPYIPGSKIAVVNAAWNTLFEGGIPENTPLIGRCS